MSQLSPNLWHPSWILPRSNPFLPLPHPADLGHSWSLLDNRLQPYNPTHGVQTRLPLILNPQLDPAKNPPGLTRSVSSTLSSPVSGVSTSPTVQVHWSGVAESMETKAVVCKQTDTRKDKDDSAMMDEGSVKTTSGSASPMSGQRNSRTSSEAETILCKKFATRETTGLLKTWLNQHRSNPYPTKAEKLMLALITRMNLTQISTWFANARRRLKKENRMTWAPKIRHYNPADLESGNRFRSRQSVHMSTHPPTLGHKLGFDDSIPVCTKESLYRSDANQVVPSDKVVHTDSDPCLYDDGQDDSKASSGCMQTSDQEESRQEVKYDSKSTLELGVSPSKKEMGMNPISIRSQMGVKIWSVADVIETS